ARKAKKARGPDFLPFLPFLPFLRSLCIPSKGACKRFYGATKLLRDSFTVCPLGLVTTASRLPSGVFWVVFAVRVIVSSSILLILRVICEPPWQNEVQSKRTCMSGVKPVPEIVIMVWLKTRIFAGLELMTVNGRGRTSTA